MLTTCILASPVHYMALKMFLTSIISVFGVLSTAAISKIHNPFRFLHISKKYTYKERGGKQAIAC